MSIEKITINFIEHSKQRYDTLGDWYYEGTENFVNGELVINISETGNQAHNFMLVIHEITEALLCNQAGISDQTVDQFDFSCSSDLEPGEQPGCPYFEQHAAANVIESLLGIIMGVKRLDYELNTDQVAKTYVDYDDELEVEVEDDEDDDIDFDDDSDEIDSQRG